MSTLTNIFSDIANALRSKMGVSNTYTPAQMAPAINNIPTGIQPFDTNYGYVAGCNNIPVEEETFQTEANYLFRNNSSMDYDVYYFGDSIINMYGTFFDCSNFNKRVIIGNNVTNMGHTFYNCRNFSHPIVIPDSVIDMNKTFYNCSNFNQPIIIGNNVTNMWETFIRCLMSFSSVPSS